MSSKSEVPDALIVSGDARIQNLLTQKDAIVISAFACRLDGFVDHSPFQVRKFFHEDNQRELAESIKREGLIRSLGGWDEVKKMRLSGQNRIKSDQRILGESDFVSDILSESEEQFSRKYRLKSLGYDFEKVVERISILFQVEKDYITGRGRQKDRVRAKDLLCYWTVVELGMPMVDLARKFDITPAAVL